MERNLTTGSVLRNILLFSLPYLLSYFLQTLYGMADLFIIGQFEGVASTTAVSVGSQVMHMITVMLVGLAMGSTVTIAQAVGGEKRQRAADAVGSTATIFLALSVVLTLVLLRFVYPIVSVMSTPAEAVAGTAQYLTICFLGIPCITAGFGLIMAVLMQFIAAQVVSLFTPDQAVWVAGGQYLRGYILDCALAGIHFSFSGYFCARGRSEFSFLHNIISLCLARLPGAYLTSLWFPASLLPMGLATAAGSLVSVLICLIAYRIITRKDPKVPTAA